MNPWKTEITMVEPNTIITRGYLQDDLIGKLNFGQAVYLLLTGELPSVEHGKMMNAILVACIDHGVTAPSCITSRTVASCGVPFPTAISAGLSAIGDYHGGAIENAMKMLQNALKDNKNEQKSIKQIAENIVTNSLEKKRRIPGLGHRYHTKDPRTQKIFKLAKDLAIANKHVELFEAIQHSFTEKKDRRLPINVDGAIAAVASDMGFDPLLGKSFFLMGRAAGLTAHVFEETTTQKPVRTIKPEDAIYTGPELRKLNDE